ncbi:MAG: hypothetical protein D6733_00470 [Methanobacteriota archaeon]|nr:MAG: hypothetical protein D6733_00470 [Euryarchaeota archaeon]
MHAEEKGQITVEAVLILGFFLMIFIGVTVPMTFNARYTSLDTTVLADAKYATEQIASAANTVVVDGSRRTIDVYIPGYRGGSVRMATRICTDGNYLNTTVGIMHPRSGYNTTVIEAYNFSARLYGGGWSLTAPSGKNYILEDQGRRYTLVIEYKSINSTTSNSKEPAGLTCNTKIETIMSTI